MGILGTSNGALASQNFTSATASQNVAMGNSAG